MIENEEVLDDLDKFRIDNDIREFPYNFYGLFEMLKEAEQNINEIIKGNASAGRRFRKCLRVIDGMIYHLRTQSFVIPKYIKKYGKQNKKQN